MILLTALALALACAEPPPDPVLGGGSGAEAVDIAPTDAEASGLGDEQVVMEPRLVPFEELLAVDDHSWWAGCEAHEIPRPYAQLVVLDCPDVKLARVVAPAAGGDVEQLLAQMTRQAEPDGEGTRIELQNGERTLPAVLYGAGRKKAFGLIVADVGAQFSQGAWCLGATASAKRRAWCSRALVELLHTQSDAPPPEPADQFIQLIPDEP
ncbi:MAG: hypothetical protein KC912_23720 [Proteobacteria bacterium]|nr:hypothetical protein [Pseudomonadota bacterium]